MELSKIQSNGSWGEAADSLNQNFQKVNNAVEQVKNATTRNKGYFSSDAELKSAFPTANVGDVAYVGSAYPYQTWNWNGSAWVKKNNSGGDESVNLGNYYTKEETDGRFDEADAKLSELGSYVSNPEYARAYTDAEGRFLWGIKHDGSIEFAKGVPTPIKNYIVKFVFNRLTPLEEAHEQYLKESESPEWARVIVDADGKVLWGIRQDGSVEFTKGVPSSIKAYIDSLDRSNDEEVERINQIVIGLLADVKVLTDTYHYVSNPEWACAIVDAEERILMGIKADGSYYIPNRDMYHVESNPEWLSLVVDADDKIIEGVTRNGEKFYGTIPPQIKKYVDKKTSLIPVGDNGIIDKILCKAKLNTSEFNSTDVDANQNVGNWERDTEVNHHPNIYYHDTENLVISGDSDEGAVRIDVKEVLGSHWYGLLYNKTDFIGLSKYKTVKYKISFKAKCNIDYTPLSLRFFFGITPWPNPAELADDYCCEVAYLTTEYTTVEKLVDRFDLDDYGNLMILTQSIDATIWIKDFSITPIVTENKSLSLCEFPIEIIVPKQPSAEPTNNNITSYDFDEFTPEGVYALFDKFIGDNCTKKVLGKDSSGLYDIPVYHIKFTPLPKKKVFINANIHGFSSDTEGAYITLYNFCRELCIGDSNLFRYVRKNFEFLIMPLANPWGCANRERHNYNQVNLNRNFPSGWFKSTTSDGTSNGITPLSEVECQYIKECIYDESTATPKVDLWIDIHETPSPTPILMNINTYKRLNKFELLSNYMNNDGRPNLARYANTINIGGSSNVYGETIGIESYLMEVSKYPYDAVGVTKVEYPKDNIVYYVDDTSISPMDRDRAGNPDQMTSNLMALVGMIVIDSDKHLF